MVSILCPICNTNIVGEGELDLSMGLQAHMSNAHNFTDLCDLSCAPAKGEKERRSEVHEEGLSPLPYSQRAIQEWHGSPEERPPGEDVPESVRCPVCGSSVRGYAADDLSYNLAAHFSRDHNIKVKLLGKG
ncbi:hypothetical protein [Methanomassiliicoccus luminyensis]|uniref:hypothetical protein n=1 Tax=Methanomassiliicoccus luminyensis TaxID=1080712 RepID=UPI00038291AC|nr:hypothetical protein [Methanomassiliicoccus luminyensis]